MKGMVNIAKKMFVWHAETFITQEYMCSGVKLPAPRRARHEFRVNNRKVTRPRIGNEWHSQNTMHFVFKIDLNKSIWWMPVMNSHNFKFVTYRNLRNRLHLRHCSSSQCKNWSVQHSVNLLQEFRDKCTNKANVKQWIWLAIEL